MSRRIHSCWAVEHTEVWVGSPCGVISLLEWEALVYGWLVPVPAPLEALDAVRAPGDRMSLWWARLGRGGHRGPGLTSSTCAPGLRLPARRARPEDWRSATAEFGSFPRVTAVVGGAPYPAATVLASEFARHSQAGVVGPVGGTRPESGGDPGVGAAAWTERCRAGAINHQVTDLINFVPGGFFFFLFPKNQRKQNIFLIK